jgi:hypothetical protein
MMVEGPTNSAIRAPVPFPVAALEISFPRACLEISQPPVDGEWSLSEGRFCCFLLLLLLYPFMHLWV